MHSFLLFFFLSSFIPSVHPSYRERPSGFVRILEHWATLKNMAQNQRVILAGIFIDSIRRTLNHLHQNGICLVGSVPENYYINPETGAVKITNMHNACMAGHLTNWDMKSENIICHPNRKNKIIKIFKQTYPDGKMPSIKWDTTEAVTLGARSLMPAERADLYTNGTSKKPIEGFRPSFHHDFRGVNAALHCMASNLPEMPEDGLNLPIDRSAFDAAVEDKDFQAKLKNDQTSANDARKMLHDHFHTKLKIPDGWVVEITKKSFALLQLDKVVEWLLHSYSYTPKKAAEAACEALPICRGYAGSVKAYTNRVLTSALGKDVKKVDSLLNVARSQNDAIMKPDEELYNQTLLEVLAVKIIYGKQNNSPPEEPEVDINGMQNNSPPEKPEVDILKYVEPRVCPLSTEELQKKLADLNQEIKQKFENSKKKSWGIANPLADLMGIHLDDPRMALAFQFLLDSNYGLTKTYLLVECEDQYRATPYGQKAESEVNKMIKSEQKKLEEARQKAKDAKKRKNRKKNYSERGRSHPGSDGE
eukprot:GHVT01013795.1.p1 GENE.GHVT01013795.1~~GHVT01013795.1.p1  ORF type:complete len:533 (+),score=51.33 GHVT01013795.1:2661-4259(+)